MSRGRSRAVLLGSLFFVSGATGLIYEVVWAKYLALLLGSTAHAQLGVLAVFMAGLALGSAFGGGAADRAPRPLRLYGLLEIGIGLSAILFVVGFGKLSEIYWATLALTGGGFAEIISKVAFCAGSMLVPTICMGATLPVLTRALDLQRPSFGRGVAYLYALNSFGAACGSVLAGFVLVPSLGLDEPMIAAAFANVLIGSAALLLAPRFDVDPGNDEVQTGPPASTADRYRSRWLVPACAAISGSAAMIYEVGWIRLCSLVLGSSTYSFCVMLTAFILGIAAGGLVYSLWCPSHHRPIRFYAYSSLASAVLLLMCLPFYDRLPFWAARLTWILRQHDASFSLYQTTMLVFCVAVMLPLTFVSGLNLPALAEASAAIQPGVGRPVGYVLFANTLGTIAGAALSGLYLLPLVGLQNTFVLGGALTALAVLLVLLVDTSVPCRAVAGFLLAVGGVAGSYASFVPAWDLRLLTLGEFRQHEGVAPQTFADYVAGLDQRILYYRDGASATVSVERRPEDVVLRINGKVDASAQGDRDTQLLLGHLPAVLLPQARHALVIGYGSGTTTGALLRHPFESVDVVEISPEVMESDALFQSSNGNPLSDPRTHVFIEDARTFLYRTSKKYDVIVSEPSNPWLAGIANLFTAEFFEQAKEHLSAQGLLVQWFHTYESNNAVVAMILRTVAATFAEVRAFQPNVWDVAVVASPSPLQTDRNAMQRAFDDAADLSEVGIKHLSTLLGSETLPPARLRAVVGAGSINRDRLPLLEYAAPRAFFDGRTANLLANAPTADATDFVLAASRLDVDEIRDQIGYLIRTDLLSYAGSLRFFTAWMTLDPNSPALRAAITRWSTDRPLSALLVPALLKALPLHDVRVRRQYAVALLQILSSLVPRPTVDQVRGVEPLVREIAGNGDWELLRSLGSIYLAAAGYAEALRVFDDLAGDVASVNVDRRTRLQCARGEALKALGRKQDADVAFRTCATTPEAALQAQAAEALQRLNQ